MKYALQLAQAGLDVHFYGACFNNTDEFNKLSWSQLDSFKFYLSFENSVHCEDYVTEKFWVNGLLSGRVPIVFGASKENMVRLAPPGSYIHTEDFKSPGHLAEYLSKLDKNETAYRRYFDWRVNPDHQTRKILSIYDRVREKRLCDMLQNDSYHRKSYRSIAQFVYVSEPDVCLKGKD
uniref:Fucosyltransferase n=1 Tax=Phallusia mammillata TaxID=59560 RepID=A0A6F9DCI6_9ASCI|nr:alpha-(1,3)-fucosyltransferase 5-like [Phallusia mammillata]